MKSIMNTKFLISLFAILSLSMSGYAQTDSVEIDVPDLEHVQNVVKNNRAAYDSLTVCFKNMDTSSMFTLEEAHIIYYGFAYTEKYSPYSNAEADIVGQFLKDGEIDKAESAVKQFLDTNPVLLELYEYQLKIAKQKQDEDTFRKAYVKLTFLLDIISGSGEGNTLDSPLYVIRVSDEYSFLRCTGATELISQALVESPTGKCDKMVFKLDEESMQSAGIDSITYIST